MDDQLNSANGEPRDEHPAPDSLAPPEPEARQPGAEPATAPAGEAAPAGEEIQKEWYVLKVSSNREESIREGLLRRINIEGLGDYFGEIVVPTERRSEFKNGRKRILKVKLWPGYLVVNMAINDATWHLVRGTPGIGDFVGTTGRPTPMLAQDVAKMHAKLPDAVAAPTAWVLRKDMFAALMNRRADAVSGGDAAGPFLFHPMRHASDAPPMELYGTKVVPSSQVSNTRVKGTGTNLTYILLGYFPAAWGFSPAILLPMGTLAIFLIVQFAGRSPMEDDATPTAESETLSFSAELDAVIAESENKMKRA